MELIFWNTVGVPPLTYKLASEEHHIKYTGVSNKKILQNLDMLCNCHGNVILRCPIIPGINDTIEHFHAICNLSLKYKEIAVVELMPYHNLGYSKAEALAICDYFDTRMPSEDEKRNWLQLLHDLGCKNARIG